MLCIYNSTTNPYANLAAEEYVLKHFKDDIFMLWRNEPAIIVGKYQNTLAEINLDFVKEHQIKVVRRLTGGGAVFHDLGNLNFTFIENHQKGDFRTFTEPILEVLNQLKVNAQFEGRNDLTINGRKFSGNAQCIYRQKILHHGTLLFSSVMSDLSSALKVNPLKFEDKAVKSVQKRVTNISEHLQETMTFEAFARLIMKHIMSTKQGAELYEFTQEDKRNIAQLVAEKYSTWEWNFGTSPQYTFSKMIRTKGGNVEVHLKIEKGKISDIKFYGDFFACREISELEALFMGKAHRKDVIHDLLQTIDINNYILYAQSEEIENVMF